MRLLLVIIFIQIFLIGGIVQAKETFDLTSCFTSKGWSRNSKSTVVGNTIKDKSKGGCCQNGTYKSANSKISIGKDFEREWKELVYSA